MVTFSQPAFLIVALCLVPGFLIVSIFVRRFQTGAIDRFGKRQTMSRFSRFTPKTATMLVYCISLVLLGLAAAEPKLESSEDANSRTLNAIIVLDVSRSMLAEDGPQGQSRLEAGILAVERLLETYPDGYFGLVVYTGLIVVHPPTLDHQAISVLLRDILENYSVRGEGSSPLQALRDAGDMIEGLSVSVDTIILISDGGGSLVPHAKQPPMAQVVRSLRELGVRLVTAGVGGFVPAAIPVYAEGGELVGHHQFGGAVVYTSLDEFLPRRLAEETSGWYLRLTGPDDLVTVVRSQYLDSQPAAKSTIAILVWLPVAISLTLMALWLVVTAATHPRRT